MSSVEIDYLGEGVTDDAMARQLIIAAAGCPGVSRRTPMSGTGKSSLDRRLSGINAGLSYGASPILILRDLDHDAGCAPTLLNELVTNPHESLFLRICVHASEAWLLADTDEYARYCGVAPSCIPSDPERLVDPKAAIMTWAEGHRPSKLYRHFRDGDKRGVPRWAAFANWNQVFVETRWNAVRAAQSGRAPSLSRALYRLQTFVENRVTSS